MPRNLELKARVGSLVGARRIAASIGAKQAGTLIQKDTFLIRDERRLKLRQEKGSTPELIYYSRADHGTKRGRSSTYLRLPVRSVRAILHDGSWPVREKIVVDKVRSLYLFRNARIHLDRVSGLGMFIEFEVLAGQSTRRARNLLDTLVESFSIQTHDIVAGAYADLLQHRLQP